MDAVHANQPLGTLDVLKKLRALRKAVKHLWVQELIRNCEKDIEDNLEERAGMERDGRENKSEAGPLPPAPSPPSSMKTKKSLSKSVKSEAPKARAPCDAPHLSTQPASHPSGAAGKRMRLEVALPPPEATAICLAARPAGGAAKRAKAEASSAKKRHYWSEADVAWLKMELERAAAKLKAPNFKALAKKFGITEVQLRKKALKLSRQHAGHSLGASAPPSQVSHPLIGGGGPPHPSRRTPAGPGGGSSRDKRPSGKYVAGHASPQTQQPSSQPAATLPTETPLRTQVIVVVCLCVYTFNSHTDERPATRITMSHSRRRVFLTHTRRRALCPAW